MAKTHPKDRSGCSNGARLAGSVDRPWEDSTSRRGSLWGYMCWGKRRAKKALWRKAFRQIVWIYNLYKSPTNGMHGRVALTKGIRSDNTIGNLDSFRGTEGTSRNRGRWPACGMHDN